MFRFVVPLLVCIVSVSGVRADEEKGWLGVQVKLDDGKIKVEGVLDDSPAAKAGLKQGDIVQKLGDIVPTDLRGFVDDVGKCKPGDKVVLLVSRDGKEVKLTATIGKRPE